MISIILQQKLASTNNEQLYHFSQVIKIKMNEEIFI